MLSTAFKIAFDETAAKEPPESTHERTPGAYETVRLFCSSLMTFLLATYTSLIFNAGGVKRCAQLQRKLNVQSGGSEVVGEVDR